MSTMAPELRAVQMYPFDCPLCGRRIKNADDRSLFHGLGNCADICELCDGTGELKGEGSQCPPCLGSGVQKGPKA